MRFFSRTQLGRLGLVIPWITGGYHATTVTFKLISFLNLCMKLAMAAPAQQLKVIKAARHGRIVDVLRRQVDFVVDDLTRNV